MPYELFQRETNVVEDAKDQLDRGALGDDGAASEFAALLKNYEKLFKDTRRLVRLSDRNQEELNSLAKSLSEKNKMLEALSSKLAKYLSPQVYASIFTGKREVTITTDRKKLTIFFSDIKDFTATTDDLEPEDLADLLNNYLSEMSTIALRHGATIDKFIGDAMLLFFGDPETRGVKEDAAACLRMAIEMQQRMDELEEIWRQKGYERPFRMRIGINTGYCNVGNFGSEDRMDYTIIGGEVNLAARLEGIAEPGGITMSYETYALVRSFVSASEGKPIRVKGIPHPVRPFAVAGIHDDIEASGRFIRKERDGMQVFFDLDQMNAEGKAAAVRGLQEIIKRFKAADRKAAKKPAKRALRKATAGKTTRSPRSKAAAPSPSSSWP